MKQTRMTSPRIATRSLTWFILAPSVFLMGCAGSTGGLNSGDSRMVWNGSPVMKSYVSGSFITLTLGATLTPPTVNGVSLDANDVFVSGLNTYVSYNIPGASHAGAIDQVLLSNPILPIRTASTTFATSTINGLYLNGTSMYAIGSTNDTTDTGWPAFITQVNVGLAGLIGFSSPVLTKGLLNTYAGTAVTMWNSSLYALSGANGSSTSQGLQALNPTTFAQTAYVPITDARGFSAYSSTSDLFVVAGGGNVYDINTSNAITHTIAVGGNTIPESKSTIQAGKTMLAVSKGDAGAAIVCQADQKILATLPAVGAIGSLTAAQTVTNAVTAGPGLLFVANGQAGVYVYTMVASTATTSVCKNVTLSLAGIVTLGSSTYSANNIRYVGGVLYIATGSGGFQIISVTTVPAVVGANNDFL